MVGFFVQRSLGCQVFMENEGWITPARVRRMSEGFLAGSSVSCSVSKSLHLAVGTGAPLFPSYRNRASPWHSRNRRLSQTLLRSNIETILHWLPSPQRLPCRNCGVHIWLDNIMLRAPFGTLRRQVQVTPFSRPWGITCPRP